MQLLHNKDFRFIRVNKHSDQFIVYRKFALFFRIKICTVSSDKLKEMLCDLVDRA